MAAHLRILEKELLLSTSCLPGAIKVTDGVSSLCLVDFFLLICAKDGGPLPHSVRIAESGLGIVIVEADD